METTVAASTTTANARPKLHLPKAITTKRRRSKQQADGNGSIDGYGDNMDGESISGTNGNSSADDSPSLVLPPSRGRNLSGDTSQTAVFEAESAFLRDRTPTQNSFDQQLARASTVSAGTLADHSDHDPAPPLLPSKTSLAPPPNKARRSPSPGGRFRDVFRSKKTEKTDKAEKTEKTEKADGPDDPDADSRHSDSPTASIAGASGSISTFAASSALPPVSSIPPVPPIPPIPASSTASALPFKNHDNNVPVVTRSKSIERFRRLSRGQKIDTRPVTPAEDTAAPIIVNTPPTPTESNNSAVFLASRFTASPETTRPATSASHSHAHSSSFGSNSMISQRRARAGSLGPSKLSSYTLASPLSPTPENAPATPSSGFFSSMLSAAQNATSTLSSSITNTNIAPWNNAKKSGSSASTPAPASVAASTNNDSLDAHSDKLDPQKETSSTGKSNEGVEVVGSALTSRSTEPLQTADSKEPAVKTLGMGDLSLSQLGIVDHPERDDASAAAAAASSSAAAAAAAFSTAHGRSRAAELMTDTRNRADSAPTEPSHAVHTMSAEILGEHAADDSQLSNGKTFPLTDTAGQHGGTPPAASLYGDKDRPDYLQRTGSSRSLIGRRRNRGSSAATGGTATTIAAAIAAANASVANPATAASSTPRLTGFAVASKKRNREFHNLFKSVPDDDYLIEDYSCALQREILAHGRLYVSEGYICFSSNILGWVTTLVMSFDEIVSVEKRSTALVFKNGLMISTLHAKHIFASFASRDSTYDLIVKIWKLGHPSLQSSLNGVHIDETGGDKTEKIDHGDETSVVSRSMSISDEEEEEEDEDDESGDDSDEVYDEDAEDHDVHDSAHPAELSVPAAAEPSGGEKAVSRKSSGTAAIVNGTAAEKPAKDAPATPAGGEFPGPLTHAPTDCGDSASHFERQLADEVIAAPMGKVYNYIFGQMSTTWLIKWLGNEQKCFDIQSADRKGLSLDNKSRTLLYTKPLYGSIGPKQTRCVVSEQVETLDFEKAIHIVCSTQTPDVPSGNVFTVKTRYCFSWAENNSTRVQINCAIEWTGKSWLKAPIEKGANDGQMQYSKDLFASLKEVLSSHARPGAANGVANGKGKKKGRKGKTSPNLGMLDGAAGGGAAKKPSTAAGNWGMLEPVHDVLGPIIDILRPLLTGNVMYGLLVGLLVAAWFGFGGFPVDQQQKLAGGDRGFDGRYPPELAYYRAASAAGLSYPERMAAYDEMWRREESELWEWLEERVGLDRLGGVGREGGSSSSSSYAAGVAAERAKTSGGPQARKHVLEPRAVEDKLREERMDSQDIREAIRVTEEKLRVLRSVMERQGKSAGQ